MPSDCLHVGGFRVSFTPLTGVLFTVPSRYSSAIGRCRYLALESGLPSFRRPSTGAAVLACHAIPACAFGYGPLTRSGAAFQSASPRPPSLQDGVPVGTPAWSHNPHRASATAHMHAPGLGSSPFARHYLGSTYLFLGVLRCFSSPGSLRLAYRFSQGCRPITGSGLPHSGISGSVPAQRLPGAFRSAPRPSSACNAKASTTDVCSLTARCRICHIFIALHSAPIVPEHLRTPPAGPDPEGPNPDV
jgi:hypothetical protein